MKNSRKAAKSQRADYHKFISWRLGVFARNNYFSDNLLLKAADKPGFSPK